MEGEVRPDRSWSGKCEESVCMYLSICLSDSLLGTVKEWYFS